MSERQPRAEIEDTPRDAAKDLIRPHVRQGETLAALRGSALGVLGGRYDAMIGGFLIPATRFGNDRVGVSRVGDRACRAIFSLAELYEEIKGEVEQESYTQGRLL